MSNVFLTGGNLLYPGMKERVERELLALRPFQSHFQVCSRMLHTCCRPLLPRLNTLFTDPQLVSAWVTLVTQSLRLRNSKSVQKMPKMVPQHLPYCAIK